MTGIPSVAFAVREDELPTRVETCWDVGGLVQQKINQGKAWQTEFENEWQRTILKWATMICPSPALDYLFDEVRILKGSEIANAIGNLDRLRSFLLSDISTFRRLGFKEHNPSRKPSDEEMFERAHQASGSHSVVDDKYATDAEAFFSFLASQRELLEEASTLGTSVLHVQFHG